MSKLPLKKLQPASDLRGQATDYRLLSDPRFKKMIATSRSEYKRGKVTRIEDL